jgi:hypothetical protein
MGTQNLTISSHVFQIWNCWHDVPNQRIQVWQYDTVKGWQQVGKDISTKFTAGDVFTVRVLPDGTLELSQNGKLLAKRKVGS